MSKKIMAPEEANVTELEDKVWKYCTKRTEEHNNNSITIYKISENVNISIEEVKQILEQLAQKGEIKKGELKTPIVQIPPIFEGEVSWNMNKSIRLLIKRWVAEDIPEKPIPKRRQEIESPPPKESNEVDKEFDEIMKEMRDKYGEEDYSTESKQDRMHFTEESLETERTRRRAAAKAYAKKFIKRYNLESEKLFRRCQICQKSEAEIYIPDSEYPLLVNVLCHSHLMKEVNEPTGIQTISLRTELENKYSKTKAYSKSRAYDNRIKNANTRKKRFRKRFQALLPEFHCMSCGVSESKKQINLRIINPDNPYRVIPLCPECMQKYMQNNDLSTFNDINLRRLDLVELIGIHTSPELKFYEAEILTELRKGRKELECYVCGLSLKETELYLDRMDENGFFLACPDCRKTAKADLLAGFGKNPTIIDLRGLDL